ncbi:MAG: heme ABC transporter ATP-binding protein [Bacteroidota bacterium]
MIEVRQVGVKRGGRYILEDVSIKCRPGVITVLLGKNGAGKSTLLECLSGQITDYEGQIIWNGQNLKQLSPAKQALQRAVLAQSIDLSFNLRVHELVEMGCYGRFDQLTRKERQSMVDQAVDQLQLRPFLQRDFLTLSGGERKRVLLAKCLVQLLAGRSEQNQQFLLLDEPTAALDMEQQFLLLGWIRALVKDWKLGVVAVLHDLNLAAQLADELVFLKHGKVSTCGSTKETIRTDVIRQVFDIDCIIQRHPTLDCPLITTIHGSHSTIPQEIS